MKSEITHTDGRRIDLAGFVDPATYTELERTRSPRLHPVLRCGGCGGGIYIKHGIVRKDELFGAHHDAGNCRETLVIRKSAMSDEHKREAEYHARAAEHAGYAADLEVATTGNTRVDVVVDGDVGFEIQRSALTRAAAVDRTARSVKAGLRTVAWFTDRTTSPPWAGHVPGYRTVVPASAWQALPLPGTVGAAGLQVIETERRGTRHVPRLAAWTGLHVDDVVTGLAEGVIRPVRLGKFVRLMSADSVTLYEELTGVHLQYDAGKPKSRALPPSAPQECDRAPAEPPQPCVRCSRSPRLPSRALCVRCNEEVDVLVAALGGDAA